MELVVIPSILKEFIEEEETKKCIIPTICEKVTLYNSFHDMKCKIYPSVDYLIRFLDEQTKLPLEELYDVENLNEDDVSEEAIEALLIEDENENNWDGYSKDYPLETARQFLPTVHYQSCRKVFQDLKNEKEPELHRPLLDYFSKEDNQLLEQKGIRIFSPKLNKIQRMESKGKFATSFFKWYLDGKEVQITDLEKIKEQLLKLGIQGIHTGFAFGKIDEKIGIIEFDGEKNRNELKHLSFWKFRDSCDYTEIIKKFSFCDF